MNKRKRRQTSLDGLRRVRPQAVSLTPGELVKTSYFDADVRFPLVIQPAVEDVDLSSWAGGSVPLIEEQLAEHGAILFRNFGVSSIAGFERFATTIRPELFDEYGDLPREEGKVYKSTPYPSDKAILFHNESSHMHRWPMKQWFYCVTPAQERGETPIVDCRRIYQRLDREIVENFRDRKLMYVRNYVEGLDVNWRDFFGTSDKSQVEEYCERNGIEFEWGADDVLRTRQICPGVVRHPLTGQMSFFNQVQLHHISCLDEQLRASALALFSEEDMPRNVFYGDGSPIEDDVIAEICRVFWDNSVSFSWQAGDILMVDNMLVAHARNPYGGERRIAVALAEMFRLHDLPSHAETDSLTPHHAV